MQVFFFSARGNEVWLELKTPNFQIYGNTSQKEILQTAEKLESFHQNFQKSFGRIKFPAPFPSQVIVVRESPNFLLPSQNFINAEEANFIMISLSQEKTDPFPPIFRSYTKFLIENNLGINRIPAWLMEGLAQYFANSSASDNFLNGQQNNLLTLADLWATDYYTLQKQPVERKRIFAAQSWAFLSFLLSRKSEGKLVRLEQFLERLKSGEVWRKALLSSFQTDLKSLEIEFAAYLESPQLLTNSASEQTKSFAYQVNQISQAESLAILGNYLFYANQSAEAVKILQKSLEIEKNQSLALTTLALIKAQNFYYAEAEDLAERALAQEPENFFNYYRYAQILSKQGMTEFGFVAGYPRPLADKMRSSLTRAIDLNPDFTAAYALLAFVNFIRNEDLENSLESLKKILQTAPGNQKFQLRLAEINLRKENFREARRLALEVLRHAPNEELKLYAQNTVQRIDSTEFQLEKIKEEKKKYIDDETVTEKPMSEEEIRRLREKAQTEQIRITLRRPNFDESRTLASLTRINCEKGQFDFIFKTQSGTLRLQAKSLDGINLISFIEEMSDFELGCGAISRENYSSIIYKKDALKAGLLVSIEFVPKGFKF